MAGRKGIQVDLRQTHKGLPKVLYARAAIGTRSARLVCRAKEVAGLAPLRKAAGRRAAADLHAHAVRLLPAALLQGDRRAVAVAREGSNVGRLVRAELACGKQGGSEEWRVRG